MPDEKSDILAANCYGSLTIDNEQTF